MVNCEVLANKLFTFGTFLSILTSLARPDYNSALFVFAWFSWKEPDRMIRQRLFYLLLITFVIDLIWLLYWGSFWYEGGLEGWEGGLHRFTVTVSIIGLIVKGIVMVIVGFAEKTQLIAAGQDFSNMSKGFATKFQRSDVIEPQGGVVMSQQWFNEQLPGPKYN